MAFTIDGVLRDTIKKFELSYLNTYPNNKIKYPIIPYSYLDSFDFDNQDELIGFIDENHLDIFGNSKEQYKGCMNQFNDLYYFLKEKDFQVKLISKENGKVRSSTLYYLSNNGCEVEEIKFYATFEQMWQDNDIIITTSNKLLLEKPKNKKSIKVLRDYNQDIESDYVITDIKDIFNLDF